MPQSVRARKPRPKGNRKSGHTTADKAQPEQGTNSPGRETNGRFARGKPGGPGNPHARFSAQMLTIARQTMTPEKIAAVFEAIYVKTLTGDMSAAKLLLHYTIGKPGEAPHPDYIERDEWDLYQKNAMTLEEVRQALGGLPCSLGNEIVGAALPAMTEDRANELAAQLMDDQVRDEGRGMKDEANVGGHVPASESTQDHAATAVDPWEVDGAPPLTNRKTESAPDHVSPATRHHSCATTRDVAPPLTNRKTEAGTAPGDSRRATRHHPPTSNSSIHDSRSTIHASQPLTNRVSNGSAEGKKRPKLIAKQWLQPLAKKLNGRKQKSKKRKPARA